MQKQVLTLWQPAFACLLQGYTALQWAAEAGHVDVVETLLLNGADPEARNKYVSCTLSIDTAYIACEVLVLIDNFSCSNSHVHVSCLIW